MLHLQQQRPEKRRSIFSFLTNITSQAGKCDFDHLKDSMICDCIISGRWSECMKVRLRDLVDLDLNTVIRICKNDEFTKTRTLDSEDLVIYQVKHLPGYG